MATAHTSSMLPDRRYVARVVFRGALFVLAAVALARVITAIADPHHESIPYLVILAVASALPLVLSPRIGRVNQWARTFGVGALLFMLPLVALNLITPGTGVDRVAGADRVGTSVAVSRAAFGSADAVVLARADAVADAVAAAPLAGRLDAPLLLTEPGALAPRVRAEISRLGARHVVLIGGPGALSPAIARALRIDGIDVTRLAGTSRVDTAAAIAREVGGTDAYLVQASAWPDAVAVSALAARLHRPLLLVDGASVPPATLDALDAIGIQRVTLVGGAQVIPERVETALHARGFDVGRLAGATRYATSAEVARRTLHDGASAKKVWLATGDDWPDALAAGPAVAHDGGVFLLLPAFQPERSASYRWLRAGWPEVDDVTLVGGRSALPRRVLNGLG